jgi:hypothetical protein
VGAGGQSEPLIAAMEKLCAELGADDPGPPESTLADRRLAGSDLNTEDELLVRRLRTYLARIAAALGRGELDFSHPLIPQMVLDGAEMMMRGEIIKGNRERLAQMMPDFVFLVAMPGVDQDRALELSRRTSDLIQAARED